MLLDTILPAVGTALLVCSMGDKALPAEMMNRLNACSDTFGACRQEVIISRSNRKQLFESCLGYSGLICAINDFAGRIYCLSRFAMRTKWIDDRILQAVNPSQEQQVRQVVVLGAGMAWIPEPGDWTCLQVGCCSYLLHTHAQEQTCQGMLSTGMR